jgi:hypothetical protein
MRGSGHLQSISVGVVSILSGQQLLISVLCCVVLLLLVLLLLRLLVSMDLLLNEGEKALRHLYEAACLGYYPSLLTLVASFLISSCCPLFSVV